MQIENIPPDASIELDVSYNGHTMSFSSNIALIIDNTILITAIKANNQTIGFNDDCRINFIVKFDNGKVYKWNDVTVKLVKYEGVIYNKIDLQGDGTSYNRREAFRMYIGEDMPIYINSASGPISITVLIKDLSETGVSFITKEDLAIDRTIRLRIKDNHIIITISGIIVRKEFLPHLDSFLYGCKFIEKNQKLGKFIAKRQGEELRRMGGNSYTSPITIISSPNENDKK